MRIDIITTKPAELDDKIFKAAADGTLETWEVREVTHTGKRFLTPVAAQYKDVVILELTIPQNPTNLFILRVSHSYWSTKVKPDRAVNAIVLGMFTATLLTHFSDDFTKLEVIK